MTTANIGEGSHVTDDFAECVRAFPCDRKRTDASRADSTDGSTFCVLNEVVVLANVRKDFFQQETRIPVTERIVLDTTLLSGVGAWSLTGIDEDANRNRHFALVN